VKIRTRTSCGEKPSEGACSEEGHVFVLDIIIISLTQVASRGISGIPSCCFKAKGVDTKSETSHAVNGISRKVKKHISGKPIRRMGLPRATSLSFSGSNFFRLNLFPLKASLLASFFPVQPACLAALLLSSFLYFLT